MKRLTLVLALASALRAASHGPVFGLATPTNSKGEWSFDSGVFGRSAPGGTQLTFRELVAYGVTPHLTFNFTLPAAYSGTSLPPTRIQPGDDFEAGAAWRFQHNTTKVGTRLESTAFASLFVPGTQSPFTNIGRINRAPGTMVGAVTGWNWPASAGSGSM